MKKPLTLVFAFLLTAAVFATEKPNVIFILCDDLGYGDVGFTLRERDRKAVAAIKTPNLDRLAEEGVVLTDHVCAAPVCIASRASIMTGQLQLDGHCSVRNNQFDYPIAETNTLGSVMKRAGYHTMAIGKWGIGGGGESGKPVSAHPLERGFDRYYGFMDHRAGHTYYHYDGDWGGVYMGVWEGQGGKDGCAKATNTAVGRYSTDVFIAKAKEYISDAVKDHKGEPFFLFMAVNAVHGSGRNDGTLSNATSLHVPGRPYPSGGYGAWPIPEEPLADRNTWIDPRYRNLALTDYAKRYATTVSRLDDAMGDLLDHLDKLGVAKDTVIIFTSDNGPANEYGADTRFFNSAGGFDGLKRSVYEGGERMPTFVHWPNGNLKRGIDSSPSISVDWLPTLADIGGVAPGASDGVSLLPRLKGEAEFPASHVEVDYTGSPGNGPDQAAFAARKGAVSGRQTMVRTNDIVSISVAGGKVRRYDLSVDPHQDFDLGSQVLPGRTLSSDGDVSASEINTLTDNTKETVVLRLKPGSAVTLDATLATTNLVVRGAHVTLSGSELAPNLPRMDIKGTQLSLTYAGSGRQSLPEMPGMGDAVVRPLRMAMGVSRTSGIAEFSGDKLPVVFDDGFLWTVDGLAFGKGRKGCLQRFEQHGGRITVSGEYLVFADGPATVNYNMDGGSFMARKAIGRLSGGGQARIAVGGGEKHAWMSLNGIVSGDAPGCANRLSVLRNGVLALGSGGLSFVGGHVFALAGGKLVVQHSAVVASKRPIAIDGYSAIEVTHGVVATVEAALSGEGALEKTGGGRLDLRGSLAGLSGELKVKEGRVVLNETNLANIKVSVEPGAKFLVEAGLPCKPVTLFLTDMTPDALAERVKVISDGKPVKGEFSLSSGLALFTPKSSE